MNAYDAYEILSERLRAGLPTGYISASVKFPNAPFVQPADKWLRVTMQNLNLEDLDAAGECELIVGRLIIDIFVNRSIGFKAPLVTAQEIKNRYNRFNQDSLVITQVEINPRGEDGNWFAVQVVVSYNYEFSSIGV